MGEGMIIDRGGGRSSIEEGNIINGGGGRSSMEQREILNGGGEDHRWRRGRSLMGRG